MEKIAEIFVVLENRPSTVGDLCRHLAENGINIESIGVFQDTAKLIVKNPSKVMKILSKLDYITEMKDVLMLELENRPGAIAEITSKLGDKGINIEYLYGTLINKGSVVTVILDVSDIDRAMRLLSAG